MIEILHGGVKMGWWKQRDLLEKHYGEAKMNEHEEVDLEALEELLALQKLAAAENLTIAEYLRREAKKK